jgi:hypothetical protein
VARIIDAAPEADPLLTLRSAALITASPEAGLQYAARLARVAAAAGRPLSSVHALSCFSLNGGPHRALFDATADLLPYVGPVTVAGRPLVLTAAAAAAAAGSAGVECGGRNGALPFVGAAGPTGIGVSSGGGGGGGSASVGTSSAAGGSSDSSNGGSSNSGGSMGESAVSKWLHDYDTAPRGCDPWASPHDRPGLIRRSRADLGELQAAAGLWVELLGGGGALRRAVCWDGSDEGSGGGESDSGGAGGGGATGVQPRPRDPGQPCAVYAYMWV